MSHAARADIVRLGEFEGEEWLRFPNISTDVATIRGTAADQDGDVSMEHEGAYLGPTDIALAARSNGGAPLGGFAFGCAANAHALLPSPYQFIDFQGGRLRRLYAVLLGGRRRRQRERLAPRVAAPGHLWLRGLRWDHFARAQDRVFRLFPRRGLKLDVARGRLAIHKEGEIAKFVPQVDQVTFSGRRARSQKQDVTYVTERCMIRLLDGGPTATEVTPGVDLGRAVLAQAGFRLAVAPDVKTMNERLFREDELGRALRPRRRAR